MTARPQTIQIYLPGGDPRGIRLAEITTRIVQVLEVPRSLLGEFLMMQEAKQVAVYFLVQPGSDTDEPKDYIGQSSDLIMRFGAHNKEKEFWQRALVLISRTHSLTQTHALYLEWLSIQEAKKAGRYFVMNGNGGSRPYTPAPLEADCNEIHDTGRTLLATLGHPIFEPVVRVDAVEGLPEMLYCKGSSADGRGYLTDEGFVVLAGSSGRRQDALSIKGTADERFRQRLIDTGVLRVEGNRVVMSRDHLFRSPSMAAVALVGRTANGWREWKDAEGKTLHALKRSESEPIQ